MIAPPALVTQPLKPIKWELVSKFAFKWVDLWPRQQGVDYDVPYHRQQAAKRTKQLQDLDRREGEYKRGAAAAKEKFIAACDEVGVKAGAARSGGGGGFALELDRVVGRVGWICMPDLSGLYAACI